MMSCDGKRHCIPTVCYNNNGRQTILTTGHITGGGGPFTGEMLLQQCPEGNNAVGSSSCTDRAIDYLLHTRNTDSQCFSVGQTTPTNCPILWGISTLSNTWIHGPTRVSPPPQMTSRLVQPFLHSTSMLPTLRQTMLCVTSDAKGRIYVTYVMQSNKDCTSSCNTLLLDIMS